MSLYKRPGSEFWWINIAHAGQRVRRSSGETDRVAAQRIHDEVKADLWKAQPKIAGLTWGKAVAAWCDVELRSESELLSLAKFGRGFPDRKLTDLTADAIDARLRAFCRTPGTYTRYRTMLAAILALAVGRGWLREAPKLHVWRVKKAAKPRDWLTLEQWQKLYLELPSHLRAPAAFALATGLRRANVLGLTWDRVDLDRRLVWIEAEDAKGAEAISVPLSIDAVNLLTPLPHREGAVFLYRGQPIVSVKTAFMAACIRAGLGRYEDGSYVGFTWHGLRHTWATWHVQNGTPLDVLQKLGAWSDLRMVMNYAHHAPSHLAGFADNSRKKP
jgi:integrase